MSSYKYIRQSAILFACFAVPGIFAGPNWAIPSVFAQQALFIDDQANVGIGTDSPQQPLHLFRGDGTGKLLIEETSNDPPLQAMFELVKNGSPYFIFKDQSRAQSYSFAMLGSRFIISHQQEPGVEFELFKNGNLVIAGSLTQNSSRSDKRDIVEVEPEAILRQVMELPLTEWSYKDDAPGVRHLGPMAEDFSDVFGLGFNDSGISAIDTSGVALAAIQGLKAKQDKELAKKDAEIAALRKEKDADIAELKAELSEVKELLARVVASERVASVK